MRNEDEAFADIIKQEFDEQWSPPSAPEPELPPPPQSQPLPDFHLNLYDDEESYRDVPRTVWKMAPWVKRGLILIAVGVVITFLRIFIPALPIWIGWVAIACFIAGVGMCIWYVTHTHNDDNDEGVV